MSSTTKLSFELITKFSFESSIEFSFESSMLVSDHVIIRVVDGCNRSSRRCMYSIEFSFESPMDVIDLVIDVSRRCRYLS